MSLNNKQKIEILTHEFAHNIRDMPRIKISYFYSVSGVAYAHKHPRTLLCKVLDFCGRHGLSIKNIFARFLMYEGIREKDYDKDDEEDEEAEIWSDKEVEIMTLAVKNYPDMVLLNALFVTNVEAPFYLMYH
jgi:hypothetical protein